MSRKQTNASLHASTFRANFLQVGQEKLASNFAKQFQITADGDQPALVMESAPIERFDLVLLTL